MGPKAQKFIFNQVKKSLKMYKNTLLNVFNSTIGRLEKKVDMLKKEHSSIEKRTTVKKSLWTRQWMTRNWTWNKRIHD